MSVVQDRALTLLAQHPGGALVRNGDGYALYTSADRRRRPRLRLTAGDVHALMTDGALSPAGPYTFALAPAGAKRAARLGSRPEEAFLAQHGPIGPRAISNADGKIETARGFVLGAAIARLREMKDSAGGAWFDAAELAAARQLRLDWEAGQRGLSHGSDWTAPPRSGAARGPGNAAERAMAAGLDARGRVEAALARLAPQLRRVVERVCFHEDGVEALERAEHWPARSGKVALKLALAQLAARR